MDRLQELQYQVNSLTKKVDELEKKKSIEDIILKSKFVLLGFNGNADGTTLLTKNFDNSIILSKNLLLKSLRIIPYYGAATVDIDLTDGITNTTETIAMNVRVNRVLDSYTGAVASFMQLFIDSKNEIFNVSNTSTDLLPPDFEMDNIYALYKNIGNIDIACYFEINDPAGSTPAIPNVKVYLECYIF